MCILSLPECDEILGLPFFWEGQIDFKGILIIVIMVIMVIMVIIVIMVTMVIISI